MERGDAWTLLSWLKLMTTIVGASGFVQHNVVLVFRCLRGKQDHAARYDAP